MEIAIGIIGILIAVAAIYYPIRFSKKINVIFLKPNDNNRIDKAISLYFEKIPDEQRIPPDHLIKSLKIASSALSMKDFKNKITHKYYFVHLPLIVEIQKEVVGFLKAIYVKELNYVFIAYLISKNFNEYDSTRISSALINKFYSCIKNIKQIEFIIFEIVEETNEMHLAKERLFKHTARIKNFKAKHIDAPYLIPEVCSFDEGKCDVFNSRLFYLDLKNDSSTMSKERYLELIESIYKSIYTESYKVSEPELVDKHILFIESIKTEISQKLTENISLI